MYKKKTCRGIQNLLTFFSKLYLLLTRLCDISEFCTYGIVTIISLGVEVFRLVGMSYGVEHGGSGCVSSVSIKSSSSMMPHNFMTLAKSNFPVLVVSDGNCDV